MSRRGLTAAICACLLAAFITGCVGKPAATPAQTPPAQQTPADSAAEEATRPPKGNKPELVIALYGDISGLNPMTASGGLNDNCLSLTHETLFRKTDSGSVNGFIATEGVWTSDTTYELMLRTDVTFSDGSRMTAADVAHTIETARALPSGPAVALLTGVTAAEAVTEDRVRLTTTEKIEDLEWRLSDIALSVQSRAAYETGMQNPYLIGTGPYKFADRVNGRYTTFAVNELYWGTEAGVSKRISFYAMVNDETRARAVLTGNADIALFRPGTEEDALDVNEFFRDETGVRLYGTGFSGVSVVYRAGVNIPAFYENIPMPWAQSYVVLE